MRDKLIQILQNAGIPQGTGLYADGGAIDVIAASLRCDKCRHWEQWDTSYGECKVNSANMERLDTEADFFCAKWEGKA